MTEHSLPEGGLEHSLSGCKVGEGFVNVNLGFGQLAVLTRGRSDHTFRSGGPSRELQTMLNLCVDLEAALPHKLLLYRFTFSQALKAIKVEVGVLS